jgi:hypothetical protein
MHHNTVAGGVKRQTVHTAQGGVTGGQEKAHRFRWALLSENFAGTPRDPDGVSTAARHPLARIPIAQWDGLRSPHWVRVSGYYRTPIV